MSQKVKRKQRKDKKKSQVRNRSKANVVESKPSVLNKIPVTLITVLSTEVVFKKFNPEGKKND